jgi:hypothetical protein
MSQLIEITASSGLTGLVGRLFANGSDTVAATASSVAEATNRKSVYVATFTGVTVGTYQLLLLDADSLPAASRTVRITATSGTFTEIDNEQAVFDRLGAPAGASIAADIAAIEGGGGDTAEEIVDEIVARGITAIPVQSGVTSSGNLDLVQGDTYNGTAKPLLSFPTSTDYTSGWTAKLTIRDVDDAVIATADGVVASATQVTVSLTAPTGLTFEGCPGLWQGKFDVQMSKNTERATIATGTAYVREDQTRT